MSYVVDFMKTPQQLLTEPFTEENGLPGGEVDPANGYTFMDITLKF